MVRFSLKKLLVLIGVIAIVIAYITALNQRATKEHKAFDKLRKFGVYKDDWVNFQELLTGKTAIHDLYVPKNAPAEIVFEQLPNFVNLRNLSIEGDKFTKSQIKLMRNLNLTGLDFEGKFPSDEDVSLLYQLTNLRYLSLRGDHLSNESKRMLTAALPSTNIEFQPVQSKN